jgi:hypothetical protein
MEDWLTTFGTFSTEPVAGAVNNHYLAANNKSLVVRVISSANAMHSPEIYFKGVHFIRWYILWGSPRIPSW